MPHWIQHATRITFPSIDDLFLGCYIKHIWSHFILLTKSYTTTQTGPSAIILWVVMYDIDNLLILGLKRLYRLSV